MTSETSWNIVLRVWANRGGSYIYQHDGGTHPVRTSPQVIVDSLRSLASDIESKYLTADESSQAPEIGTRKKNLV